VRAHDLGQDVRRAAEARYLRAFEREHALSPRTRRMLNEELVRSSAPWITATSTGRAERELAARFERETRGLVLPEDVAKIFAR
jgi:hypothetical protein